MKVIVLAAIALLFYAAGAVLWEHGTGIRSHTSLDECRVDPSLCPIQGGEKQP